MSSSLGEPTPLEIPESHRDLMDAPLTAVLTTVSPAQRPQATAVWYLVEDGILKTSLLTTRQKYKNLVKNPAASLFVLDPAKPQRSIDVRADVELLPDPGKRLLPLFADRYHVDVAILEQIGDDRAIAVFHPRKVLTVG